MCINLRYWPKLQKPSKNFLIKMIPLVLSVTLFLLTISLGAADPGSGPPVPN